MRCEHTTKLNPEIGLYPKPYNPIGRLLPLSDHGGCHASEVVYHPPPLLLLERADLPCPS